MLLAWVGPSTIGIIALLLVLFFGYKRLPQAGRSLGGGIREFKDAITKRHAALDAADEAEQAPARQTDSERQRTGS